MQAITFAWSRRRLRNLIILPALLVLAATLLGARPLYHWLNAVAHDRLHIHAGALGWLLSFAIFFVSMVLLYLAFLLGSTLALAPLGGTLADRTEAELRGKRPANPTTLAATIKDGLTGAGHTILAGALFVLTMVPLVFLGWLLPFLAPLVVVQAGLFLAYDGLDPMLSKQQLPFREKWRFLRAHLGGCLGFGVMGALFFAIPVVNLFASPVVAIGGTLLYFQLTEKKAPA